MKLYNKLSPYMSVQLDITRAVAAGLVALMHIRVYFFQPYINLTSDTQNVVNYFLFFITRLGHEAVIIFFLLSGYLVGGALLSEIFTKKVDWTKYFVNRLSRMWVVLIPALIIGGLCDYASVSINNDISWITDRVNISFFLGNIAFLQEIFVPFFGSNSPLWSLANEFWYYMIWPVLMIIVFSNCKPIVKYILIIALLGVLSFFFPKIMVLFPIWIGGALLRLVSDNNIFKNRKLKFLSYIFFGATLVISNTLQNYLGDYLVAIASALVLLYWQYGNQQSKVFGAKTAHFFSDFSFSLYAVHYFLLTLVFQILNKFLNVPVRCAEANFLNWGIYILVCIVIFGMAWLFYRISEHHTPAIRKWAYNLMVKK